MSEMRYKIVYNFNKIEFERAVQEMLDDNWEIINELHYDAANGYFREMIKYNLSDNN